MLEPFAAASACLVEKSVGTTQLVAKGASVAVGAACGKVCFTAQQMDTVKMAGGRAILVKADRLDDTGVDACDGLLLVNSSTHSTAAQSARTFGSAAVNLADVPGVLSVVLEGLQSNQKLRVSAAGCGECVLRHGDDVTIDGFTGNLFRGTVVRTTARTDEDYQTLLQWAHKYKRMQVYAAPHSMEEVELAARQDAEGLAQCRTDWMFRHRDCMRLTQAVILSHSYSERCALLNKLLPLHQDMFLAIFRLFPHKDLSFRLMEASMAEFLPKVFDAVFSQAGRFVGPALDQSQAQEGEYSSSLPGRVSLDVYERHCDELATVMGLSATEVHSRILTTMPVDTRHMGFRGARLAVVHPELVAMQTRALIGAAIIAAKESDVAGALDGVVQGGLSSRLEISIPTVASDHEIEQIAPIIKAAAEEVIRDADCTVCYHIAASLEVPRSCMRADAIAHEYCTSSVTIDTDHLTWLMYGCDKHDCAMFLPTYKRLNIFPSDPFQTIDQRGVGSIMEVATTKVQAGRRGEEGRMGLAGLFQSTSPAVAAAKRDRGAVKVGVCGLHCRDPASVAYFSGQLKVDFIAPPAESVNVALILAAKAAIRESAGEFGLHLHEVL